MFQPELSQAFPFLDMTTAEAARTANVDAGSAAGGTSATSVSSSEAETSATAAGTDSPATAFGTEVSAPASAGRTLFAGTGGSAAGDGSAEKPFATIQSGCDALQPGDSLLILPGTYREKIRIRVSGEPGQPVTVRPSEAGTVRIEGGTIASQGAIFALEDVSHVRIEGLELANNATGDVPSGIFVEGGGTDIVISGNRIHGISTDEDAHGIAFYGTDGGTPLSDIRIVDNEVWDCVLGSSESVVVNGNVTDFVISGNRVHDNDNIGIDCIGFEGTAPSSDQARNGVVSDNEVWNITSADNPAYEGDACAGGIYVDGGMNIVIERNFIRNCDIGVEIASEHRGKATSGILVRANVIDRAGLYGLCIGGAEAENGTTRDSFFVHNTVYGCETGIALQQSANNVIMNNIVVLAGEVLEGAAGTNRMSNNLLSTSDSSASGSGPKFVNAGIGDFRLQQGSAAIGAGDAMQILPYVWPTVHVGETAVDKAAQAAGRVPLQADLGAFQHNE